MSMLLKIFQRIVCGRSKSFYFGGGSTIPWRSA